MRHSHGLLYGFKVDNFSYKFIPNEVPSCKDTFYTKNSHLHAYSYLDKIKLQAPSNLDKLKLQTHRNSWHANSRLTMVLTAHFQDKHAKTTPTMQRHNPPPISRHITKLTCKDHTHHAKTRHITKLTCKT